MPKCSVKSGEDRNTFVSRCVKEEMDKGTDQEAAVGKCEGIYNEAKKSETRHVMFKSLTDLCSMVCKAITRK